MSEWVRTVNELKDINNRLSNLEGGLEIIADAIRMQRVPLHDWRKRTCGECGYWSHDCIVVRGVVHEHGTSFDSGCRKSGAYCSKKRPACPDFIPREDT